jgi:hypothetical protein
MIGPVKTVALAYEILCMFFGQYPFLFKLFRGIDDDLAPNISD